MINKLEFTIFISSFFIFFKLKYTEMTYFIADHFTRQLKMVLRNSYACYFPTALIPY